MGFNIGSLLSGAASGFMLSGGNPFGAAVGAISGAVGGSSNPVTGTGNLANTGFSAWESYILAQQQYDNMQNAAFQLQLGEQASQFNNMMDEKSELMRESNTLREVAMEQRKADISITKEFIKSIS
jgi:hypothetical protein